MKTPAAICFAVAALALPSGSVYYASGDGDSCAQCHEIRPNTDTWHASTHRTVPCKGCHGEHLSGGPLPGAPPSIPVPLNLTPDLTGLREWTFDDFERLMRTGVRKNGKQLDPFMPIESWRNFNDVEMHAIWAYLRTVPPMPWGSR